MCHVAASPREALLTARVGEMVMVEAIPGYRVDAAFHEGIRHAGHFPILRHHGR